MGATCGIGWQGRWQQGCPGWESDACRASRLRGWNFRLRGSNAECTSWTFEVVCGRFIAIWVRCLGQEKREARAMVLEERAGALGAPSPSQRRRSFPVFKPRAAPSPSYRIHCRDALTSFLHLHLLPLIYHVHLYKMHASWAESAAPCSCMHVSLGVPRIQLGQPGS